MTTDTDLHQRITQLETTAAAAIKRAEKAEARACSLYEALSDAVKTMLESTDCADDAAVHAASLAEKPVPCTHEISAAEGKRDQERLLVMRSIAKQAGLKPDYDPGPLPGHIFDRAKTRREQMEMAKIGTGRTTARVLEAVARAVSGQRVIIVAKDEAAANSMKRMARDIAIKADIEPSVIDRIAAANDLAAAEHMKQRDEQQARVKAHIAGNNAIEAMSAHRFGDARGLGPDVAVVSDHSEEVFDLIWNAIGLPAILDVDLDAYVQSKMDMRRR